MAAMGQYRPKMQSDINGGSTLDFRKRALHQRLQYESCIAATDSVVEVGNGPILLKNSDFGQNQKIFPRTAQVKFFGEGFA